MMKNTVKNHFDIKLALLGFFVALFSAGIGIGGGALLVSLLVSVFAFDFNKAAGTSLATIIPISFIGAVSHFILLTETPDLKYYFVFIPACMMGTILGGRLVQKRQSSGLKVIFAVFLLMISLRMLKIFDFPFLVFSGLNNLLFLTEWFLMVLTGLFIGFIAVLLGIGCGLLIVPFFVMIIHLNIHQAITLSLTTMFFITLLATIIRTGAKNSYTTPEKGLFLPALAGAVVGAVISGNLPAPLLKKGFGLFLFLMACNYILQATYYRLWGLFKNHRERIKETV